MTFAKQGYQRLNESLSHNATSGRTKVSLEARCRVCGQRGEGITRHHLVPHAWFLQRRDELRVLRNANANIVPLCRGCHAIVDGVHDPVGRLQKRAVIRQGLYPNEVAFILQVRGRDWLDHAYPLDP